ncbi:Uma2 family endonuclease [Clostridium gasigenes]|uniref:Uma2 family endonuclease n=1 Tax=Clostridium gasigenes TaxID=94869 RepID=A0A7X0VQY9_9CLOT|nr:Uma2 family endonuclease [Clostridium gasigenes]MBB6714872.1 Uma2 family endonuclease [Clostridium gasigenes]
MTLAKDYDYMTYDEFLDYQSSTNQKTEYSNGDIFYMSPTHPNHNKVQNELYFQLRSILNNCNKCDVYTSDVAVKFQSVEESYQFEPDVMITCDNKFDGSIYKGIPTLIIEVLSSATKDRDKGIKLNIYEKFGVKEYWVVDINLKEITIYSDNINGKYRCIRTYTEDMHIEWNKDNIKVKDIFIHNI